MVEARLENAFAFSICVGDNDSGDEPGLISLNTHPNYKSSRYGDPCLIRPSELDIVIDALIKYRMEHMPLT